MDVACNTRRRKKTGTTGQKIEYHLCGARLLLPGVVALFDDGVGFRVGVCVCSASFLG